MKDIFGKTTEGVHEFGLVDMISKEDFEQRINAVHKTWDQQEFQLFHIVHQHS